LFRQVIIGLLQEAAWPAVEATAAATGADGALRAAAARVEGLRLFGAPPPALRDALAAAVLCAEASLGDAAVRQGGAVKLYTAVAGLDAEEAHALQRLLGPLTGAATSWKLRRALLLPAPQRRDEPVAVAVRAVGTGQPAHRAIAVAQRIDAALGSFGGLERAAAADAAAELLDSVQVRPCCCFRLPVSLPALKLVPSQSVLQRERAHNSSVHSPLRCGGASAPARDSDGLHQAVLCCALTAALRRGVGACA
jgi:hypothetical protein